MNGIISLNVISWVSRRFPDTIIPAPHVALTRGVWGILIRRYAMRVNTCENCGKGFWTGDDYETICFTCACALAKAPKREVVVKYIPPPIHNKVNRPLKVKVQQAVGNIIAPLTKRQLKDKEQARVYEQNKKFGYVYLMQSSNGLYKIGISKRVTDRLKGLRRQFPVQIEVIHYFACRDRRGVERLLHKKYSGKRAEYEWFQLSKSDVRWIKSIKDHQLDDIA